MGSGVHALRWAVLAAALGVACASADAKRAPRKDPDAGSCEGGRCADAGPGAVDAAPPPPEGDVPPPNDDSGPVRPDGSSSSRDSGRPPTGIVDSSRPDVADAGRSGDAGPVCGNHVVEVGEQCDDGNPDAGDGCEPDCTRSECTADADCGDRLFCNGTETCVAGRCVPGVPPPVDDGVACTIDDCDEGAQAARHVPDDDACDALDGPNRCVPATDELVRDEGVCRPGTGCEVATIVVEDCADDALYPTTYSCAPSGPAAILRHDGVCARGAAACGYADAPEGDCAAAIPSPHPFCSGNAAAQNLTHHHSAQATCGGGARPVCGYSESTTPCGPGNPACTGGRFTTYRPTCTAGGGCGRTANPATACPDASDTCTTNGAGELVHTTFTPACASATACGAATPAPATCAAPASVCNAGRLTTRAATCDVAAGCGVSGPTTAACPVGGPRCVAGARVPTRRTFSPACAGGTACASPGTPTDTPCPASPTTCAGGRLTTYSPTCAGGACGETPASSSCPDLPNTCQFGAAGAPIFTTYTPRCNRTGTACMATPLASARPCNARRCGGPGGNTPEWETCNAAGTNCVFVAQAPCTFGCDTGTGTCIIP